MVIRPQMMRMSQAVSVARCCWQRHPSVPVQNWEVRQEKLLNWLRLQWEMSGPGQCVSGSGAASKLCLSHRRPAQEQHWDSCISGVRDGQHGPRSGISPVHPLGVEGEAGTARAVLCWEHKEVCSIVWRGSQTCFAAEKYALPSATLVS